MSACRYVTRLRCETTKTIAENWTFVPNARQIQRDFDRPTARSRPLIVPKVPMLQAPRRPCQPFAITHAQMAEQIGDDLEGVAARKESRHGPRGNRGTDGETRVRTQRRRIVALTVGVNDSPSAHSGSVSGN
jgi:hypothetical protein